MKFNKWHVVLSWILIFSLGYLVALEYPVNTFVPYESLYIRSNYTESVSPMVAISGITGEGNIGKARVGLAQGSGRTLIDTNPFIEPDTQLSATTAKTVAENLVGKSLVNQDLIYSFDMSGTVIGGPSAGAAMAAATVSAMKGRDLRQDVVITGTINYDGSIGQVGSIVEKAKAAGEAGMSIFLVPKSQGTFVRYTEEIKREEMAPGFIIRKKKYVPEEVDLNNYTMKEFGMRTIEVNNLREVLNYMLIGE